MRPDVNNCSSDNHTNRVKQVSKNVQIGSLYVEILFDYLLRWFVDLPLLDDALAIVLIVTVLGTIGRLSLFVVMMVIMMVIMTVTMSMSMAMVMMVMMVMVAMSTVRVGVIVTMSRAALPSDMDVATLPRVQYFDLDAIENAAKERNSEHDWPFDLGRIKESLRSFDQKPGCHDPDRENRAESAQYLDSMVPESILIVGVFVSDLKSTDGDSKACHVSGYMRSFRQNGNRVCCIPANDLNDDKET